MAETNGHRLIEMCSNARDSVLIVAPFVKDHALRQVLDAIPSAISAVTCITRWLPEEVANGVSDLEVLDQIRSRRSARLLLHPRLHGKLYRIDSRCLVGSANVTGKGLGWRSPSNLELMLEVSVGDPDVLAFEEQLLSTSMVADDEMRNAIRAAADLLISEGRTSNESTDDELTAIGLDQWLPTCPTPDRLWNVYDGRDLWRLVQSALEAGQRDLAVIGVPSRLPRSVFNRYVESTLMEMPIVQEIDRRASVGLSGDEAIVLLERSYDITAQPYSTAEMWEILKAWLEHFRPRTYRRTPYGEILVRGREIT